MFSKALSLILKFEGGYVNNPNDPGGATNKGITQAVYNAWLATTGQPGKPVKDITDAEVAQIYHDNYWRDSKAMNFATERPDLALVHFDAAVNCGIVQAAKFLQRAVGVPDDGQIGPKTIDAVRQCNEKIAVNYYLCQRFEFYTRITMRKPTLREFLRGWVSRIDHLRKEVA